MRASNDNSMRLITRCVTGFAGALLVLRAGAAQPAVVGPPGTTAEAATAIRRIIIDDEGRRRTIEIVNLKDGTLQTRDLAGRPKAVALSSVVALFPVIDEGMAKPAAVLSDLFNLDGIHDGMLYLTDGQVIPGRPGAAVGAIDRIDWIAGSGPLSAMKFAVPIDRVAGALLGGSTGIPTASRVKDGPRNIIGASPTKDTIVFANGDKSEGFISRVGEVVSIEIGSKTSDFPATRIDHVRLANPPAEGSGPYLWLADGTVVSLQSPRGTDDGSLSAVVRDATGTPAATWAWSDIEGYASDKSKVAALASLKLKTVNDPSRRWAEPALIGNAATAPLGAADIELPGPMSVEWTLAKPARRLSTRIVLPESCRRWGDAIVVIEVARETGPVREITRERLNGDRPIIDVSAPLDAVKGSILRVRLEPGENGPVQDRIILRQAIVINDSPKGRD